MAILPIFDEMKKLWPDSIYLDITGAKRFLNDFRELDEWPERIRLPYNFMTIGFELRDDEDGKVLNVAAICSEHENGSVIKFLFFKLTDVPYVDDFGNWARINFISPYCGVVRWPGSIEVEEGADLQDWKFSEEQKEVAKDLIKNLSAMVITSLGMIASIKNIAIVDYLPPMSRQVRRHALRQGGLIKHKVLAIDLGKKRGCVPLTTVTGEKHLPLHWVRGHFAKYDLHPLFGRVTGIFWKAPHMRGDRQAGVVKKDYQLRAPR